jgi:hypothetical protein
VLLCFELKVDLRFSFVLEGFVGFEILKNVI